jgi:hypothetical protein
VSDQRERRRISLLGIGVPGVQRQPASVVHHGIQHRQPVEIGDGLRRERDVRRILLRACLTNADQVGTLIVV